MPQDRFNLTGRAALLAAIAAAYPVIGYSAPAAQVDFAVGNVTAVGSNGQSRALGKGAQIEQGDTVNTNGGRAQLRFTDGAYVSLQPESQFRIDQYRFEGKTDGNEKGLFSLLKGGLRTITGLVGRRNKANYQISTSVATIGIRGTEYTIQYGKSITGTVGEGEIEVCNGAGCLSVTNGESYYVQTQEIKPVLTNKRADLPPPEPTQPPTNFTQGNLVDPIIGTVLIGSQTLSYAYAREFGSVFAQPLSSTGGITFDAAGNLLSLDGTAIPTVKMFGGDGIIAWGNGCCLSSGETISFVVGLPFTFTDLSALVARGTTSATYTLMGATPATIFSTFGSPLQTGALTSATLKVDFATAKVDATLALSANSANIVASASGMFLNTLSGSTFNTFSASTSCGATVGSCTLNNLAGFLAGANALRAGFTYDIFHSITTPTSSSSATITGAVALRR